METTYHLKTQEVNMAFLKSLKTLFAGQEIEISVKSLGPKQKASESQMILLEMISENRLSAPIIDTEADIRGLIDDAQYPAK